MIETSLGILNRLAYRLGPKRKNTHNSRALLRPDYLRRPPTLRTGQVCQNGKIQSYPRVCCAAGPGNAVRMEKRAKPEGRTNANQ